MDSHQTEQQDGTTVLVLHDEYDNLDESSLHDVAAELLGIVAKIDPPLLITDMSQTTFFGSAFLGVLFRIWHRLKSRGGHMAICGAQGACSDVLHVTQVAQLWPVTETRDEAVAALKQAG